MVGGFGVFLRVVVILIICIPWVHSHRARIAFAGIEPAALLFRPRVRPDFRNRLSLELSLGRNSHRRFPRGLMRLATSTVHSAF
jgi:hypothetical protein